MLTLTLTLLLGLQTPSQATAPADTAVLRLGNRAVWVFRSAVGSFSPAERVAAAADRITATLRATRHDSISSVPLGDGVLITLSGHPAFAVLPADVDTAAGDSLPAAILRASASLAVAVQEYRASRSWKTNLAALLWAVAATLAYALVLRLIARGARWLRPKLLSLATRVRQVGHRAIGQLLQGQVARVLAPISTLTAWAVGIIATDVYVTFILTRFPWTRPWGEALAGYLTRIVTSFAWGLVHAAPDLFILALIFLVTRWLIGIVHRLFDALAAGTVTLPGIHAETAVPTRRIVTVVIWLLGLVFAYPHFPGSGSDAFKGISVFAGLMVSLGSSGMVNQWMSGLALMYSRAFRPGDYVRIGEAEGTVQALGWLSTRIRTPWQQEVTIPNAVVLARQTDNYSRVPEGGVLVYTGVTIGYDAPWRQVHALLLEAAARTAHVHPTPAPIVRQTALSDFYVEYRMAVVVDPAERLATVSALHANIQDCFNEHGVQIMSPHFMMQPERPVVVAPTKWHEPPAQPESP